MYIDVNDPNFGEVFSTKDVSESSPYKKYEDGWLKVSVHNFNPKSFEKSLKEEKSNPF